jgi:hypothetical protein
LAICGLNARERVLFLDTFMRFGPPYVHQITEHGWVPFENKFLDKNRLQVRCLLVFAGAQAHRLLLRRADLAC